MKTTTTETTALVTAPARGSRYVHGRDLAEVAKALRLEIAGAVRAGLLPAGLKAAVRISRFSMGQSLTVTVTAAPVCIFSTSRVRHDLGLGGAFGPWMSADASRVLATITALVDAYQDPRTSRSDRHPAFFGDVVFCGELQSAQRAEIVAAITATATAC